MTFENKIKYFKKKADIENEYEKKASEVSKQKGEEDEKRKTMRCR